MAKLPRFTEDQLKDLKIKQLYAYRTKWHEYFIKSGYSERAFAEFLKAKKLIKEIEKWEDNTKQWTLLRGGLHSYNDFVRIKDESLTGSTH